MWEADFKQSDASEDSNNVCSNLVPSPLSWPCPPVSKSCPGQEPIRTRCSFHWGLHLTSRRGLTFLLCPQAQRMGCRGWVGADHTELATALLSHPHAWTVNRDRAPGFRGRIPACQHPQKWLSGCDRDRSNFQAPDVAGPAASTKKRFHLCLFYSQGSTALRLAGINEHPGALVSETCSAAQGKGYRSAGGRCFLEKQEA